MLFRSGVQLGKSFVTAFPGVQEFLGGIADFFQPKRFKQLVGGIVDIFKDFMRDLSDPHGKASFEGLMTKLREKFFDFFDGETGPGKKMLDGFQKITKTLIKIISSGIKWASGELVKGISLLTDLITGKQKLGAGALAEGGLGFMADLLTPLGEALKHAWKVLKEPLKDLVKALYNEIKTYLTSDEFLNIIKPALPVIAGFLLGPAFGRALLAIGTATIGKAAGEMLGNAGNKLLDKFLGVAAKKAAEKAAEIAAQQKGGALTGTGGLPPAPVSEEIGKAAAAGAKAGRGINWAALGTFLLGLAGVLLIGMAAVYAAVMVIREKKITEKELVMAIGTVGAVAMASLPVAISLAIISKFPLDPASVADRKSTRLNSSHVSESRMPSSA